ncbi:hypothetical protein COLO4_38262 [Corchorus olitorius]|uniref:Uncharacterized protein n=1 Tax=Corchorus olitorius TaxID=93759 RepID=A0A1R3FW14_9ROSI|nr:hypothetical protein COLO4_38262 [Corchorus olitorius]
MEFSKLTEALVTIQFYGHLQTSKLLVMASLLQVH